MLQVFVDELFQDVCSYSSLTLFHTNILYPSSVIDQQYQTRPLMAEALASRDTVQISSPVLTEGQQMECTATEGNSGI
jgi:hypothetical protein